MQSAVLCLSALPWIALTSGLSISNVKIDDSVAGMDIVFDQPVFPTDSARSLSSGQLCQNLFPSNYSGILQHSRCYILSQRGIIKLVFTSQSTISVGNTAHIWLNELIQTSDGSTPSEGFTALILGLPDSFLSPQIQVGGTVYGTCQSSIIVDSRFTRRLGYKDRIISWTSSDLDLSGVSSTNDSTLQISRTGLTAGEKDLTLSVENYLDISTTESVTITITENISPRRTLKCPNTFPKKQNLPLTLELDLNLDFSNCSLNSTDYFFNVSWDLFDGGSPIDQSSWLWSNDQANISANNHRINVDTQNLETNITYSFEARLRLYHRSSKSLVLTSLEHCEVTLNTPPLKVIFDGGGRILADSDRESSDTISIDTSRSLDTMSESSVLITEWSCQEVSPSSGASCSWFGSIGNTPTLAIQTEQLDSEVTYKITANKSHSITNREESGSVFITSTSDSSLSSSIPNGKSFLSFGLGCPDEVGLMQRVRVEGPTDRTSYSDYSEFSFKWSMFRIPDKTDLTLANSLSIPNAVNVTGSVIQTGDQYDLTIDEQTLEEGYYYAARLDIESDEQWGFSLCQFLVRESPILTRFDLSSSITGALSPISVTLDGFPISEDFDETYFTIYDTLVDGGSESSSRVPIATSTLVFFDHIWLESGTHTLTACVSDFFGGQRCVENVLVVADLTSAESEICAMLSTVPELVLRSTHQRGWSVLTAVKQVQNAVQQRSDVLSESDDDGQCFEELLQFIVEQMTEELGMTSNFDHIYLAQYCSILNTLITWTHRNLGSFDQTILSNDTLSEMMSFFTVERLSLLTAAEENGNYLSWDSALSASNLLISSLLSQTNGYTLNGNTFQNTRELLRGMVNGHSTSAIPGIGESVDVISASDDVSYARYIRKSFDPDVQNEIGPLILPALELVFDSDGAMRVDIEVLRPDESSAMSVISDVLFNSVDTFSTDHQIGLLSPIIRLSTDVALFFDSSAPFFLKFTDVKLIDESLLNSEERLQCVWYSNSTGVFNQSGCLLSSMDSTNSVICSCTKISTDTSSEGYWYGLWYTPPDGKDYYSDLTQQVMLPMTVLFVILLSFVMFLVIKSHREYFLRVNQKTLKRSKKTSVILILYPLMIAASVGFADYSFVFQSGKIENHKQFRFLAHPMVLGQNRPWLSLSWYTVYLTTLYLMSLYNWLLIYKVSKRGRINTLRGVLFALMFIWFGIAVNTHINSSDTDFNSTSSSVARNTLYSLLFWLLVCTVLVIYKLMAIRKLNFRITHHLIDCEMPSVVSSRLIKIAVETWLWMSLQCLICAITVSRGAQSKTPLSIPGWISKMFNDHSMELYFLLKALDIVHIYTISHFYRSTKGWVLLTHERKSKRITSSAKGAGKSQFALNRSKSGGAAAEKTGAPKKRGSVGHSEGAVSEQSDSVPVPSTVPAFNRRASLESRPTTSRRTRRASVAGPMTAPHMSLSSRPMTGASIRPMTGMSVANANEGQMYRRARRASVAGPTAYQKDASNPPVTYQALHVDRMRVDDFTEQPQAYRGRRRSVALGAPNGSGVI